MATVTFTVNIVGAMDADDRRAAIFAIDQENVNRTNINQNNVWQNQQRAANIPPLTPIPDLPMLPKSTALEIRNSYEVILAKNETSQHSNTVQQATEALATSANMAAVKPLWADATPAKRAAALAALA